VVKQWSNNDQIVVKQWSKKSNDGQKVVKQMVQHGATAARHWCEFF
jgi:hypothetical protein